MYALRERRQHVTQEDFEFAVAKVRTLWIRTLLLGDANGIWMAGSQEEYGGQHIGEQALLVICQTGDLVLYCSIIHTFFNVFLSTFTLPPSYHQH